MAREIGHFSDTAFARRGERGGSGARWTIRRVTYSRNAQRSHGKYADCSKQRGDGREKGESTRAVRCSLCASRLLSSKPRRRRPSPRSEEGVAFIPVCCQLARSARGSRDNVCTWHNFGNNRTGPL